MNYGYEQGFRAGEADRQDRWRSDYRDSYAYQDANYGYTGYYVDQDEYNYYFRQGFSRGYEDGFNSRYQYGQLFERLVYRARGHPRADPWLPVASLKTEVPTCALPTDPQKVRGARRVHHSDVQQRCNELSNFAADYEAAMPTAELEETSPFRSRFYCRGEVLGSEPF